MQCCLLPLVYRHCILLSPIVAACCSGLFATTSCYCLLRLPIAIACYCILLLHVAIAYCYCLLLLPIAIA